MRHVLMSLYAQVHNLLYFFESQVEGHIEFIFASEKSGFRHLYKIDLMSNGTALHTHTRTHTHTHARTHINHRYKESGPVQLNVEYGTIRYGRCSRNPLSGPLLFIYNNIYLYIYILIITTNFNVLSILQIKLYI